MDNILIDVSDTGHERADLFVLNQELLIATLYEAHERSKQIEQCARERETSQTHRGDDIRASHSVLASMTQAIPWHDPLDAYAGLWLSTSEESFFWERPAQHTALVGSGVATTIETQGETRFQEAATRWRMVLEHAVITHAPIMPSTASVSTASSMPSTTFLTGSGPTLFGGFAFDAFTPRTDLWRDFPDGLLVLPSVLLSYGPEGAALTVNMMVRAQDDVPQLAQRATDTVEDLLAAITQGMSMRGEPSEESSEEPSPAYQLHLFDLLPAHIWKSRVAEVAREIRAGYYEKVVLARGVCVTQEKQEPGNKGDGGDGVNENPTTPFDIRMMLRRLRQSYPGAYVFAMQRGSRFFVGATPERLVQAQDGKIETMALAGTARRGATPQEDEQVGAALLQSEKNNTEHAIVVEQVREALLKHCSSVELTERPHLLKLKNVQHLETPITGRLLPQRSILDVMADLHPTPAVGGFPRQQALATIRRVEQLDRGWYSGPVGWIGIGGYGEFAVALRSGLIDGDKAVLFAGCGIVGDSDPQSEYEESCLKLQVMLRSLGDM